MIDSNDKIFKVLNWINLFGIFFALFLAIASFVIFKFSIYFSIGVLFLLVGISTFLSYFYLLLREIKRTKECYLPEYWEVVYIEIEGKGLFEKYYPVFENLVGRTFTSNYGYSKDNFMVGEKVEILWNEDKTKFRVVKHGYLATFALIAFLSLFFCYLGFSFTINQHIYLFTLLLIILGLIVMLLDTVRTIIENKK